MRHPRVLVMRLRSQLHRMYRTAPKNWKYLLLGNGNNKIEGVSTLAGHPAHDMFWHRYRDLGAVIYRSRHVVQRMENEKRLTKSTCFVFHHRYHQSTIVSVRILLSFYYHYHHNHYEVCITTRLLFLYVTIAVLIV